jgi:hypothetical protein
LTQHFAGNKKGGPFIFKEFSGFGKQEYLTIHTGVEVLSVAVTGMFNDLKEIVTHINNLKGNTITLEDILLDLCFSAFFVITEKGCDEVNGCNSYVLFHDEPAGYEAVQPSGV